MEKVKALLKHDVVVRAAKTFLQAFVGVYAISGAGFGELLTVRNFEVGVAAGCVSALMNLVTAIKTKDDDVAS